MSIAQEPLPISLAIISLNEAARLEKCFRSAEGLVREIVLVDSGSSDATVTLAEAAGARVIHQPWLGHRAQKQVALDHCGEPWVLMLDCDEELSEELKASIRSFFSSGDSNWFQGGCFNRKVSFLGRWIMHGDWYPDRQLRLVRRNKASIGGKDPHDKVLLDGKVQHLAGDLLHDSFPTIASYLKKIIPYSDDFLERQKKEGKRWSLAANLLRPFWRFFRAYILRRGFLDGFPGFWIAYATAFTVFIRYSRKYEEEVAEKIKDERGGA
jgi:glycosyltransferase involved in cell wall biosynthesis